MGPIGIILIIMGCILGLILLIGIFKSIVVVKEKEVIIVERFGKFRDLLKPGIHCMIPFADRAKKIVERYYVSDARGQIHLVHKVLNRVSVQSEVIDFAKTFVISKDNASCFLDAILSYSIKSPKVAVYSCKNIPLLLSKLLQAQIRNVAAGLDVDQLINDVSTMSRLTSLMASEVQSLGVAIQFVKVQKVETKGIKDDLEKNNQALYRNREQITLAKARKQVAVTNAEGQRDSEIKGVEGEAQEMISRARGNAQAIRNAASSEATSIKEMGKTLLAGCKVGSDSPVHYFLRVKYLEALQHIMQSGKVDTVSSLKGTEGTAGLDLFDIKTLATIGSSTQLE
ncbi:hypothetical protein ADUPG1_012278 [Aduncisulcus paluster]|uniref:Band 7 domain-containing protein n=1 Tax=Aduncisulcus paluster TaxID=2918883 RepID=A0ABQ5JYY4_9EUKA|nr:hypothetical protein ADUPG1_012278 [Aduncisulcus paluster]|eukprot:gnl/Carplike_NY0171/762_a1050_2763.p1 GENE.gnl/Carplike_NY0171/762_a1050_2763~~gnl/Carplike_NY0171/762_a1050_2763.p1  ORF type:complete len:341 (+),score=83.91 gnl/Carplike_NY0171/762_a1050_2763:71-1093(+)